MRWCLKRLLLFVPLFFIGLLWLLLHPQQVLQPQLPKKEGVGTRPSMRVEKFHYTELQNGVSLYHLAGEQMHDEPVSLGDLRVAAMRVIKIKNVQLELLQPNVAGWLLEAEHGELVSGSQQLSLWGNVHGQRKQGGHLRAGRLLVNAHSGVVKLRNGYVLDVGNRHERGVATELGK